MSEVEKMEAAILKTKVDFLSKLVDKKQLKDFDAIYGSVISQHPNHLPLLQLKLKSIDSAPDRTSRIEEVIAAAGRIYSRYFCDFHR